MKLNRPVTWDNPDIAILLAGIEQYTYGLSPDTEYDVAITVHNSSPRKAAPGTSVNIRWIEFGAGGQIRHAIDSLVADVPTWPGMAVVHTSWRTPATPGHYCIEVELHHPQDGNPANNIGWNNTVVTSAASQVEAPVRIFNRWAGGRPPDVAAQLRHGGQAPPGNVVEFTFDSYVFHEARDGEADPDAMFAPRPPAWPARVEPSTFHFSDGDTFRDVRLIVDAPDGPGRPEQFNLSAWQGGSPLGGVTVTVNRVGS